MLAALPLPERPPLAAPFVLFGPAHLLALLLVALVCAALVVGVRRRPSWGRAVRLTLAALLALVTVAVLAGERRRGTPWGALAPLHLCDAALGLALLALLTVRQRLVEVLYCWACAGTLLALLTPDVEAGFPHPHFLGYFALHGGVVAAALLLVAGLGVRPQRGAAWRAWGWTNLYAAAVAGVNLRFGTNFLYLSARPLAPTPLDWFGPWPWYLVVGEVVALGLFHLLMVPFRRGGR